MADQPTEWTEVGERFTALGRTLQGRWGSNRGGESSTENTTANESQGANDAEEVRSALNKVNASLDELANTITRTVHDPEVHRAATAAAGGLVEALGASLDQLAGRIQSASAGDRGASGSTHGGSTHGTTTHGGSTDEQAPGPGPGGASGGQPV